MIFIKIFRRDPRADICDVVVQAGAADCVTSENKTHLRWLDRICVKNLWKNMLFEYFGYYEFIIVDRHVFVDNKRITFDLLPLINILTFNIRWENHYARIIWFFIKKIKTCSYNSIFHHCYKQEHHAKRLGTIVGFMNILIDSGII